MSNTDAPEQLWLGAATEDGEHQVWFDPDEGGTLYIRADLVGNPAPAQNLAGMEDEDRTPVPDGYDAVLWQKADEVHHAMALVARDEECVKILYAALKSEGNKQKAHDSPPTVHEPLGLLDTSDNVLMGSVAAAGKSINVSEEANSGAPAQSIKPVGYVTLGELNQLKDGVSCVDLFSEAVPSGFKMVPLYEQPPAPATDLLPPVVTGQMEIEPDVTAAELGVNGQPLTLTELREEMRLAAASIRQWMPETLPANEAGQIHFARLLAESAAEGIEQFLAASEGSTDA